MRHYMLLAAMAVVLTAGPAMAQNGNGDENLPVIQLGSVELVETKDTIDRITQEDMERKAAANLFDALRMEPGVILDGAGTGFRRSSYVNIRGFNNERIAIMYDGIPLANTWGREFDFGRISTFDIGSIEVSKGYSSPLIGGSHSLGGVIDIRSAKPEKPLEFKAKYRNFFDRGLDDMGQEYGISVGTKQEKFYLKASYSSVEKDFIRPPKSAPSTRFYKQGGKRDNSDSEDTQVNLMAGWTPTEDMDIMLGYFHHSGEKNSEMIYGRQGGKNYSFRRWWPDWDTERVYATADFKFDNSYLKGTVYYDKHKDTLMSYMLEDVPGNTLWEFQDNFASKYDDEAYGGRLEYGYTFNEQHKLALAANYRLDTHERNQVYSGVKVHDMEATTYDFGAEYTYKPADPMTLVFGLNYNMVNVDSYVFQHRNAATNPAGNPRVHGRNLPKHDALNWQFGAFYDLTPEHEVHFTYARKTNAPNFKSTLDSIANNQPDAVDWLDPEVADHYEIGYKGDIGGWLQLQGNVYYSLVRDAFGKTGPWDDNGNDIGTQRTINIGKVAYSGFEVGFEAESNEYLTLGANLSYLKTHIRSRKFEGKDDAVTERPEFMANAYVIVSPFEELKIIPSVQAMSARMNSFGEKAVPGFARVDLRATYDLMEHIRLEAGVENIGDVTYGYKGTSSSRDAEIERDIRDGRNYYLGVSYNY